MIYVISKTDHLAHHGIKGQKWGVRRFQNEDGSLTPEGQARYKQYAKEAMDKSYDAYYTPRQWYGRPNYEIVDYDTAVKTKKYKDLMEFVDKQTKSYKDVAISLSNQSLATKNKKEKQRLWSESSRANNEYWDEYFTVAEQYIQKMFGKSERERNKGRGFIYDHSRLWL